MEKFSFIALSTVLGQIFTFAYGNNTEHILYLKVLVFIILLDVVVGVLSSAISGTFKKRILFNGISRKIIELFLVSIAYQIDKVGVFGNALELQHIALYGYLGYEIYSIYQNAKVSNIFIPKQLEETLEKMGGGKVG